MKKRLAIHLAWMEATFGHQQCCRSCDRTPTSLPRWWQGLVGVDVVPPNSLPLGRARLESSTPLCLPRWLPRLVTRDGSHKTSHRTPPELASVVAGFGGIGRCATKFASTWASQGGKRLGVANQKIPRDRLSIVSRGNDATILRPEPRFLCDRTQSKIQLGLAKAFLWKINVSNKEIG
jgi:hypothetical protein